MAKKKSKKPEPEVVEELEDIDSSIDEDEDEDEDDDGITYTKRFTLSYFQPEKSYGGSRCYKDFYETNTLADAKKEAQKALDERKVTIMISDREKWHLDALLLQPEIEEEDDDTATTESKKNTRVRGTGKKSGDESKPKPKHPRRNTKTTRRKS